MKNVEKAKQKSPIKRPLKKKKKIEEKVVENKFVKRKLVQTSDSEPYVMEIVAYSKRKIVGKMIHINILVDPLDNVPFHSEASVQKWKYVFHIRIAHEREISKEAIDCQEIMDLMKDV